MQSLIQILFLWRRNLTDGVYFQKLISLSLSALTAIAVIFGDVMSPLSSEDQKYWVSIFILFLHLKKNCKYELSFRDLIFSSIFIKFVKSQ